MKRRFLFSASLVLLSVLAIPAAAQAAGIGLQLGVYGHNIPRAIAGAHNQHAGAGARAPSQMNPKTRSIRPDTTGESTAIRSRN